MNKTIPIYVAGHRGLIGSAILRRLTMEGFKNILVRGHKDFELTDSSAVEEFFRRNKPKVVILAAGKTGGILENARFPADFIAENLALQTNVLTAARRHGVEKLVFFGSSCMYPRECPQPMKEKSLLSGTLEPTSRAYAVAKLAGLEMCLAFNRQDGENRFLPLIPNSVYGPGDDFTPDSSHVLAALIRKTHEAVKKNLRELRLWGSGRPRREFIYCDDLADACLRLLRMDSRRLELPVNVGSGPGVSISELAQMIKTLLRYPGAIRWDRTKPDGAPAKILDSARLRATGWKPKTPLAEGIRKTYHWYLSRA